LVFHECEFSRLGAFRLPDGPGGSDWNYSGTGSAYYPSGDPTGSNDGTPGSIFAIGHDQKQYNSEISNSESMKMKYYKDPDEWSGGAWLTAGANGAVVFVGTKAMGKTWYGFSNGVVNPTDGQGPFPPEPPSAEIP
jgi:hypothetical protein